MGAASGEGSAGWHATVDKSQSHTALGLNVDGLHRRRESPSPRGRLHTVDEPVQVRPQLSRRRVTHVPRNADAVAQVFCGSGSSSAVASGLGAGAVCGEHGWQRRAICGMAGQQRVGHQPQGGVHVRQVGLPRLGGRVAEWSADGATPRGAAAPGGEAGHRAVVLDQAQARLQAVLFWAVPPPATPPTTCRSAGPEAGASCCCRGRRRCVLGPPPRRILRAGHGRHRHRGTAGPGRH